MYKHTDDENKNEQSEHETISVEQIEETPISELSISKSDLEYRVQKASERIDNHDKKEIETAYKSIYHPKVVPHAVTNAEPVGVEIATTLVNNGYVTEYDVAKEDTEQLINVVNISDEKVRCIHESTRNHCDIEPSMASRVAKDCNAIKSRVVDVYDTLLSHSYTSTESTDPQLVEQFIEDHFSINRETSIHNYDILPVGLIHLLKIEGYTCAKEIETADIADLSTIGYYNLYGNEDEQMGEEFAKTLKRLSKYKLTAHQNHNDKYEDGDLLTPAEVQDSLFGYGYNEIPSSKGLMVTSNILYATSKLNLNASVMKQTSKLFSESHNNGLARSCTIDGLITTAVRISAILNKTPRPLDEITTPLNVDNEIVTRTQTKIINKTDFGQKISPQDLIINPIDCVEYIVRNIQTDLPSSMIEETKTRIKNEDNVGKNPWTIASAAVYATSLETDEDVVVTQSEVSEAGNICNVSIRNCYENYLTDKDISYK